MAGAYPMVVFAAATAVGLAVAIYDLKTMTIPNWLTGGAAALFLALALAGLGPWGALDRLIGALVVLAVCVALFFAGLLGGGDAKAAPAFALLVAPSDAGFVLMALAVNGLIGLGVILALRRTRLAEGSWKVWSAGDKFPYGLTLAMTLILYTGLVAYAAGA